MHLLANVPFDMGFHEVYRNYSEAGHGKGPAYGVGAAIKRLADNMVLSGKGIPDGSAMFKSIRHHTSVKLFLMERDAIASLPRCRQPAVVGIIKVHQIHCNERGVIFTRHISCYCSNGFCQCYSPSSHDVLLAENDDQSKCDLPVTTTTETPVNICDRKDDQSTCDLPVATTTVTKAPLNVCDGNDDQSTCDLPVAMTAVTEAPEIISDDISEGDYVAVKIDAVKRVTGSQQWKIFYAKVLPLI